VRRLHKLIARETLALVLGTSDGTLTALTLGAGRLVGGGDSIDLELVVRIALAATATGGFVLFVARYAELRRSLVHAERQLSMRSHLAATALGRRVLVESVQAAAVAAAATLGGAFLPLAIGMLASPATWTAIVAAIVELAVLGVLIARAVAGTPWRWASVMVASGFAMAMLGSVLHIT
jgi:VIT1/CCC1 family predicted Fe2+/Mn2+ transporter